MTDTNIQDKHTDVFALLQNKATKTCLFSCFVNGKPTVALCFVWKNGDEYKIDPVLIFPTEDMVITDHDGVVPGK